MQKRTFQVLGGWDLLKPAWHCTFFLDKVVQGCLPCAVLVTAGVPCRGDLDGRRRICGETTILITGRPLLILGTILAQAILSFRQELAGRGEDRIDHDLNQSHFSFSLQYLWR